MAKLQTLGRAITTVLAQGLSSVTNFAASALALSAADGDLAAFGRFAIAFQLCNITIAIAQGSTGNAVLTHTVRDATGHRANEIGLGAATASLLLGGAIGLVLASGALIVGGDLRTPLLLAAAGSPAIVAQYTLRSARFAASDPFGVVRADTIWLLVVLAGAAGDLLGGWDPGVNGYFTLWLVGAAISGLPTVLAGLGAGRRHLPTFWRTTGPQSIRIGVDGLLARSVFVTILISAQIMVSSEASGYLAAATLIFSPMSVVHSSAVALVVPSSIRAHGIHLPTPRIPLIVFSVITAITLAWAGLVLAINASPWSFGPFDLGANGVTAALFVATLLRFLGMAFWRGPVVALRIADAAAESLRARAIGTGAQWVLPIIGLALADLDGGAYALAFATWLGSLVTWQSYRRLRRVGATASTQRTRR